MAIEKNNVVLVKHEFSCPREKVFAAIGEGRLFYNCGAWPEKTEIDFRVGGRYLINFAHYGMISGEFLEIVADRRVAFTWVPEGSGFNTRVTIELAGEGDRCVATLTHEGFGDDREVAEQHEGGWTSGLQSLDNQVVKHRLKFSREFLAPVERLYEACSDLRFFSNFGADDKNARIDFKVGGRYECALPNGKTITGEFREIAKNEKIVFTWEAAPCGAALQGPTLVTMEFGPWGDGGKNSYLELTHEGFSSDDETCSHHPGWNHVLWRVYKQTSR
jgi:uncharacterized protein YndB with AHSA1/START domain